MSAVVTAILAVLGMAFAEAGATDLMNGIGVFASEKWRKFAAELRKIINENSQKLADFKSKSAEEKASIINSLIGSSGLGARAAALRRDYQKLKDTEDKYTQSVLDANEEANRQIDTAEKHIQNAGTGFIGAGEAAFRTTGNADAFKVNDPMQNVSGGLNSKEGGK